jgi:hypothetical protein
MQNKEWKNLLDKSEWGNGPWQDEPDKIQWKDEATGMPCLIVRNSMGGLCGYVGVSREHKFYGADYSDVDGYDTDNNIRVHGGLTFSDKCAPEGKERGICHIVEPGEDDDVWWFGFDCGHSFDFIPGMHAREKKLWPLAPSLHRDSTYRTVEYVKEQVANLARQLKEAS